MPLPLPAAYADEIPQSRQWEALNDGCTAESSASDPDGKYTLHDRILQISF
jgi:hypothetical protein